MMCILKNERKISKFMPLHSFCKFQPKILFYTFMGGIVYKYINQMPLWYKMQIYEIKHYL